MIAARASAMRPIVGAWARISPAVSLLRWEPRPARLAYSALAPVVATTPRQRSVSVLKKAAVSAGELPIVMTERLRSLVAVAGSCSASTIAAESFAAIAAGVLGGATIAYQMSKWKSG